MYQYSSTTAALGITKYFRWIWQKGREFQRIHKICDLWVISARRVLAERDPNHQKLRFWLETGPTGSVFRLISHFSHRQCPPDHKHANGARATSEPIQIFVSGPISFVFFLRHKKNWALCRKKKTGAKVAETKICIGSEVAISFTPKLRYTGAG